jgi:hypothetical protein
MVYVHDRDGLKQLGIIDLSEKLILLYIFLLILQISVQIDVLYDVLTKLLKAGKIKVYR